MAESAPAKLSMEEQCVNTIRVFFFGFCRLKIYAVLRRLLLIVFNKQILDTLVLQWDLRQQLTCFGVVIS